MALKWDVFSGVAPALTKWKLPRNMAQTAQNVNLDSSTIKPWKDAITVLSGVSAAATTTIFRFGRALVSDVIYWFTWPFDVDVVKGPIIGDVTERTFYTGDGVPKWTDATLATTGGPPYPAGFRLLGVPRPINAPTVTVSGTAASNDYTVVGYAYTHVSPYGEESAPSPISVGVKVYSGQTAYISAMDAALTGNQSTSARRIYRSVSFSVNNGLYFVKEVAITGGPFADDVGSAIGEVIQTTSWTPPPSNGFGLTAMANGILIMFSGNDIWASAQYAPYAWPVGFKMATDYPILGGRAIGNQCVVLTMGSPYMVTGTSPGTLTASKIETPEACVSKRSIVNITATMPSMMGPNVAIGTVFFASQNGLCAIDSGGTCKVMTEGLLNREDWQALVPTSIQGYIYNGKYFGFFNTGSSSGGFCFDPRGGRSALSFFNFSATGGFFDLVQDHMHLQVGSSIVLWNSAATSMTSTWHSGIVGLDRAVTFAYAEVLAASYASVTFKLYGDGVLVWSQAVLDRRPFRIPGDDAYFQWEVEISTTSEVYEVTLAHNGADLSHAAQQEA